jgi:hexosaminidase
MLPKTIALALSALAGGVAALWPVPIQYSEGNTTVVLDASFTIQFNCPSGVLPAGSVDTSNKVWAAINRTYELLNDGFIPDMLYTFEQDFEPTAAEMAESLKLTTLVVTQKYAIPEIAFLELTRSTYDISLTPKAGEVNESYTLSISPNSSTARIVAESSYGVIWALQSFNQLFYTHTDGSTYTTHAPVEIVDEPIFKHRGINVDLSRHFYPKATVLKIIETMSWQKFNRFHMHVTDSQSWSTNPQRLSLITGHWKSPPCRS